MQKCELVYLVLAAAFISVFTDNPVGGENLAPDIPSAVWIGLQPITSHIHCASLRRYFQRHIKEQLLIEL